MKDDFDTFALIMLIRWLQNYVPAPNGQLYSLEKIAEDIFGVTRHTLNRFLSQALGPSEQAVRAREYAVKLKPVFDQGRPFPTAIGRLYGEVYGEHSFLDIDDKKPVQLPEVLRHRAMVRIPRNHADPGPLFGLSALVRLSSETVPAPELGEGASLPGWSISVLSVLPEHVQRGLNHPLFILRQRALNSNQTVTINGVVIPQAGRLGLQGIDTTSGRSFQARLGLPEEWSLYRNETLDEPIVGSGVMMGLSTAGHSPFAGLFEAFAIPGTTLGPKASTVDRSAFDATYKDILRNDIGVRNLDDTVATMKKLGIRGSTQRLKDVLRTIRNRTRGETLLKP